MFHKVCHRVCKELGLGYSKDYTGYPIKLSRWCYNAATPEPQSQGSSSCSSDSQLSKNISISNDEQLRLTFLHPDQPPDPHILQVAIIGAPNAGKSTLTNRLMGWRVSAVSSKVHTTRRKILGIFTEENKQVVYLDTPGVVTASEGKRYNLGPHAVKDPHMSLGQADLTMVIVDVSNKWTNTRLSRELLCSLYQNPDKHAVLVLNKIDLLKNHHLLLDIIRLLTEGVVGGTRSAVTESTHTKPDPLQLMKELTQKIAGNIGNENQTLTQEDENADTNTDIADAASIECKTSEDRTTEGEHIDRITEANGNKNNEDNDIKEILKDSPHKEILANAGKKYTIPPKDLFYKPNESYLEQSARLKQFKSLAKQVKKLEREQMTSDWTTHKLNQQKINHLLKEKKGWPNFQQVFVVSSTTGDGVQDLKDYILSCTQAGDWLFHSSLVTDQDPSQLAVECIQQACLDNLPQEVPYNIDVEVGMWQMEAEILRAIFYINCYKQRHISFVVGKEGRMIQRLASEAKQQLMNSFRCDMTLKLVARLKQ